MVDGERPDPVVPDSWSMTAVVVVFTIYMLIMVQRFTK